MIKILVMSDSHGRERKMREIIEMHNDADLFVFLGDGIRDAINCLSEKQNSVIIPGNCDSPIYYNDGYLLERTLDLEGVRIFCSHGHKYGVKYGLMTLKNRADEKECSLALYGHTHRPLETYVDGTTLFNPGSVADGSFGLVYIKNGAALVSNGCLSR